MKVERKPPGGNSWCVAPIQKPAEIAIENKKTAQAEAVRFVPKKTGEDLNRAARSFVREDGRSGSSVQTKAVVDRKITDRKIFLSVIYLSRLGCCGQALS